MMKGGGPISQIVVNPQGGQPPLAQPLTLPNQPETEAKPVTNDGTIDPQALLDAAIGDDLAGSNHKRVFDAVYGRMSDADKGQFNQLLAQAGSTTEKVMIVKAVACGETLANVATYAGEIRGKDEQAIIDGSTMRSEDTLIQQYQQTCGMAMAEVAISEYDPRYAWEMHKLGDLHAVDPNGGTAQQQLQWLHEYGGTETARGVEGGKEVGILGILNDKIGSFVSCTYVCLLTPDVDAALASIAAQLQQGFPTPIRVAFAHDYGHFMLIEGVRNGSEFRVYDPYYGKVRWMTAAQFKSGDLVPDNGNKAYLTHWYQATPK